MCQSRSVAAIAFAVAIGGVTPAIAQSAQEQAGAAVQLDEITVTARHREERERDVPFATTVVDQQTVEQQRIVDPETLFRQVPGISLFTVGDGRFGHFQLRGVGRRLGSGPDSRRAAGFSLDEVAQLFGVDGRPRIRSEQLLSKADELDRKIQRLMAMRNGLRHAAVCPAPNHMECQKFRRLLKVAGAGRLAPFKPKNQFDETMEM